MKNRITYFVLFVIVLVFKTQPGFASHVFGAEISYTYKSGTTYVITTYCYRDCSGIPLSGTDLEATDGKTKANNLAVSKCCGKDITPVCMKSCDKCTDLSCDFGFGLQRWTVTGTLDASVFSNCNITISWQESSGASTSNIYSANSTIYVESKLNRCKTEHSSPYFQLMPRPYLCLGQANYEFITATPGTKNDSIVYHLTKPIDGPSSPISYDSGFSYLSPLHYSGFPAYNASYPKGFHYDSTSGAFYFIPKKIESTYMGWQTDQYLKDSAGKYYLAGSIMRILEMIVMDCDSNNIPFISHANISSSDSIYVCANLPIKFTVETTDADSKDKLSLTYLNETGGTVSISNSSRPTGTFTWTPASSDVGKNPYTITFIANDDKCKINGTAQRRIYLFVKDSLPLTNMKVVDSSCGKYHFSLFPAVDKNYKISYAWYYDSLKISSFQDFSYHNSLAGRHKIRVVITNASGCTETFDSTISYDTLNQKLPFETGICKGASVQLIAAKGKNLQWSPSKGLSNDLIYYPVAKPDTSTLYTISALDSNGCIYTDQTHITVSDFNLTLSPPETVCSYSSVTLYNNHTPSATYSWLPSSGIFKKSGDTVWAFPGKTTLYEVTANLKGCIRQDTVKITVRQKPNLDKDSDVCLNDSVILHTEIGKTYIWFDQIHNRIFSTDSICRFKAFNTQFGHRFLVIVENFSTGCMDTGFIVIRVHPFSPAVSDYSSQICNGNTLSLTASGGDTYSWNIPGSGAIQTSSVTFKPDSSENISVTISKSPFGCSRIYNIPVYVAPVAKRYPDVTICRGDKIILSEHGGAAYYWQPVKGLSSITTAKPVASPSATTTYTCYITDSAAKCYRQDTFKVIVDTDCIWPGDANKDKICDYLDVLNIGIAYGKTGPKRDIGTISWAQYPDSAWPQLLTNGINFKHMDCNGDGIISALDTVIINNHYGQTHNKWTPGTGNPNDPPVYFKFVKDTFYSGDTALAYLYAGSNAKPLLHAYGIGTQHNYDGFPVIAHSADFQSFCDYFCTGSELSYIHPVSAYDQFDATFVETNGKATSNTNGKIAALTFLLKDSLGHSYPESGEKIYAHLISATAIDSTGKEIAVFGMDDSAIVMKTKHKIVVPPGIEKELQWAQKIKIYPNPATNKLVIETEKMYPEKIIIYNVLGQQAISTYPSDRKIILDISGLPTGLYSVELKTKQGIFRKKICIRK